MTEGSALTSLSPPSRSGYCPVIPASEAQPHTKLHLAHRVGRGDNAKAGGCRTRGRNGAARLSKVHVIEGIRGLGPEAQLEALAQTKVAREGQIDSLIARPVQKVAGRIAIGGDAGNDFVLGKGGRVEPHRRRWIGEVGIADQLRPVVRAAVEVGVNVAVGDGERQATAHLDDWREAPAIEDTTQNAVTPFAKVIGPIGQTHAKDVSLITIAGALFFSKVAVVLCQPLSRAVVELYTAKRLAIGVEAVKGQMVAHPHGAGDLQAFV